MKTKRSIPNLREVFINKYPSYRIIVSYFEEANNCDFTWGNITKARLQFFVEYLSARISQGSCKTYCSKVKAIFSSYNDVLSIPKDYYEVLKIKPVASQQVYLNIDEIKKIMDYTPKSINEHAIKNQFLLSCFTGARHSDCVDFTKHNISGGFLYYVSKKTHIETRVPLAPATRRLIAENEKMGFNEMNFSTVTFNNTIRRICRNVGIVKKMTLFRASKYQTKEKWEFVASHTARRSFATNLYKTGTDIYTISKLCGHSSIEMTKNYICCEPKISNTTMKFFKGFV